METVTVVVPTHNRPHLLRQTLQSLVSQRGAAVDIVVVDDGSSDADAVVDAVTSAGTSRIRLLRNDRAAGLSAARNRGVTAAGGEWVGFCDDDDLWAPDKAAAQVAAARRAGTQWAYSGAVNVTLDGRVIGGGPPLPPQDVVDQLPSRNSVPGGGSGVVVRRDLLRRVGPFDIRLSACEDWDMWIRLARRALPAWDPRPLLGYRVHGAAMTMNVGAVVTAAEEIQSRYGGALDRESLYRHMARVALRGGHRRTAIRWYLRAAGTSATYLRGQLAGDVSAAALRRAARPRPGTSAGEAVEAYRTQAQTWLDELLTAQRNGSNHSSA